MLFSELKHGYNGRFQNRELGLDLEFEVIGNDALTTPLVMLHDALGSVKHWREFPEKLSKRTGKKLLSYSREGSGSSQALRQIRNIDYLHQQAQEVLPAILTGMEIEKPWLFGHSDGASIALIFAASFPTQTSGLILSAPHLFVETITTTGILSADSKYRELIIERLSQFHDDADSLYRAWRDTWLTAEFSKWNIESLLPSISAPILAIQGKNDEYGSLKQVERIAELCSQTRLLRLENCKHTTYKDREDEVLEASAAFIAEIENRA